MIIKLENIKIREDITEEELINETCAKFKIPKQFIEKYEIAKKSIDARDKNDIFYNYSVILHLKDEYKIKKITKNIVVLDENEQKAEKIGDSHISHTVFGAVLALYIQKLALQIGLILCIPLLTTFVDIH